MTPKDQMAMTAKQVKACLKLRHPGPEWLWAEEFNLCPGYYHQDPQGKGRRIDGLAFNCWPSRGHLMVGYEVKVSRGDFLQELKDPTKRKIAVEFLDRFYFAAPAGMIKVSELPENCGLIECYPGPERRSRLKVEPYKFEFGAIREDDQLEKLAETMVPRWLIASIARQFDPARRNEAMEMRAQTLMLKIEELKSSARYDEHKGKMKFIDFCYKKGVSAYRMRSDSFVV